MWDFPSAPPGFLSSGPNSDFQDLWNSVGVCLKNPSVPPQKCFLDHVESWTTNEVTINLNASLSWVTYFLDTYSDIIICCTPTPKPTDTNSSNSKVPEDINGDGAVNVGDVIEIAKAFGTVKGDKEYNPACDLINNNVINMADAMKLAIKFGYIYSL